MENMLGQSMHGDHDGKARFSIQGLDGPRNSHGMVIKKARCTPSRRSCEPDTRPAAELGPSKAPLKVLRGPPNTHSAWVLALATTRVRFVLKNSARAPSCDHADALMQAVGVSPWHMEACFILPSFLGDSFQPLVTCLVSRDTKRALAATRKKSVWEHFMGKGSRASATASSTASPACGSSGPATSATEGEVKVSKPTLARLPRWLCHQSGSYCDLLTFRRCSLFTLLEGPAS